jgi:Trypsin-like peptidase domain/Effector-associated domain 1
MRLNNKRLTGPQVEEFRKAIRDAFNNEQKFKEFLFIQLDRQLDDITSKEVFPTEIFNVITTAEDEDWTEELLSATRLWRPTNTKLLLFAQQFGLAPKTPSEPELKSTFERMVRPNNKVIDVAVWREKLAQLEGQICRVEVRNGRSTTFGTGFLVGPDVIMTNYHVVRDVLKGDTSAKNVTFLFDFKKTTNTSLAGTPYHLADQDWCIDYSEYSPLDEVRNSWDRPSDEDKLDYTLMRLSTQVGTTPIGGEANKNPHASIRGWLEMSLTESELYPGSELFIIQHKDGEQLTLALDTHSIMHTNTNNTRVFYKTNTDEGSSGAPCFDIDWQLVALHQGGDTDNQPEYNQGILFSAIVTLLQKRGKLPLSIMTQNKEASAQHLSASNDTQEPSNMEARNEKQEFDTSNEPSLYDQACTYFQKAFTCLQQAHKPLQEDLYIPPAIFRKSIQYVQEAQIHIYKIIECLQNAPSLPLDIAKEQFSIIHQLRIIHDHIGQSLLPLLLQDIKVNFLFVVKIMQKIENILLINKIDSTIENVSNKSSILPPENERL